MLVLLSLVSIDVRLGATQIAFSCFSCRECTKRVVRPRQDAG